MRLLIYAMQSSGASTLAFLLAQKPDCAAFIDIWTMYAAPELAGGGDVVAKVVVTTAFPLSLHQERFRPDCTILCLRHPVANYHSLATKPYRHHCGFMEEKFRLLDRVFASRSGFDVILYYEDLVYDPAGTLHAVAQFGWKSPLRFGRSAAEIKRFNELNHPYLVGRLQYGAGNNHGGKVNRDFVNLPETPGEISEVDALCPVLTAHYAELIQDHRRKWFEKPCVP